MTEPPLRVIFFGVDPMVVASFQFLIREIAQVPLASMTPPGIHARELLTSTELHHADMVILFAGNIVYDSKDRSHEGLERSVAALVRELVDRFKVPVIVLYVYPDSPSFSPNILKAGAAAVVELPTTYPVLEKAIKPCLPLRPPPSAP